MLQQMSGCINMTDRIDPSKLDYVGYNPHSNKYEVNEWLYPESRGFVVHEFDDKLEAMEFNRSGEKNEKDSQYSETSGETKRNTTVPPCDEKQTEG